MMRKCSVREIENNYSVSHGIVAKLTSAVEFSDAEDLTKQYGGPIFKQGTRYSRLPTFHTVYDFLRFFVWIKNFLPIFHFTMLAGLLTIKDELKSRGIHPLKPMMHIFIWVPDAPNIHCYRACWSSRNGLIHRCNQLKCVGEEQCIMASGMIQSKALIHFNLLVI